MNVYFLLDRSGSMISLWAEAIGSINGYIKKLDEKDNIHLAVFDSVSYDVIREMPVEFWQDIHKKEVEPRGGTPLYDSCGKIMTTAEEAAAEKTILVVMTDGYENSSHEYNSESIKSKVKSWEDRGWEVVFLGANFDNVETVSGGVGVSLNKTLNFQAGNFERGFESLTASTQAYSMTGASINYSDAQKAAINGLIPTP